MLPKNLKAMRRRMLAVLRETGPRKRTVLDGLARGERRVLDSLLEDGSVVIKGTKRGSVYAHA